MEGVIVAWKAFSFVKHVIVTWGVKVTWKACFVRGKRDSYVESF